MPVENDIVYAVGDVHGRADLLEALQARIAADAGARGAVRPKVVYLGDYVDRGPDSRGVLDLVLGGLPGFRRVALTGNHEEMMTAWLRAPDDENAAMWYMSGKGRSTIESYGVEASLERFAREHRRVRDELLAAMPAEHRTLLLGGLETMHEDERAIFVHAGLDPRLDLGQQVPGTMLWIRDDFLDDPRDWGRPVVHGHTPAEFGPELRPNRVGVDTGAYATGALTAVALGAEGPRFLVGAERRSWHLLVDPAGRGDATWLGWAVERAASAGARTVGLCLPDLDGAAAACAARGLQSKPLPWETLVSLWADETTPLHAEFAARRIAVSYADEEAKLSTREAVQAAARKAPSPAS